MTSAQMTESERRKDRTEKLDLYQRAADDRNNYCGVLNEYIETLETIVRLHRESDLHVTGPPDRRVLGVGIILPSAIVGRPGRDRTCEACGQFALVVRL